MNKYKKITNNKKKNIKKLYNILKAENTIYDIIDKTNFKKYTLRNEMNKLSRGSEAVISTTAQRLKTRKYTLVDKSLPFNVFLEQYEKMLVTKVDSV